MSSHFQKSVFFFTGCVFSVAVIVLLGAANNQADSPRYDVDFDTILGGLGGFTIEVTDHKKVAPVPQLVATIDLTSAGKPKLEATFAEREAKEKKE